MKKIIYNKLIRDKIPEIIEKSGKKFKLKNLNEEDYFSKLIEKLKEESSEFIIEAQNGNDENAIKELADLEEVILALVDAIGVSRENFERIREVKKSKNGGFEKRLLLVEVEEDE